MVHYQGQLKVSLAGKSWTGWHNSALRCQFIVSRSSWLSAADRFVLRTQLCQWKKLSASSYSSPANNFCLPASALIPSPRTTSTPKKSEAISKHFCNLDQFNQTRLGVITQMAPEGNFMQQGLLAETSSLLTQFLPSAQPKLEKACSHLQSNNCFLKLTCKSQIGKHVGLSRCLAPFETPA